MVRGACVSRETPLPAVAGPKLAPPCPAPPPCKEPFSRTVSSSSCVDGCAPPPSAWYDPTPPSGPSNVATPGQTTAAGTPSLRESARRADGTFEVDALTRTKPGKRRSRVQSRFQKPLACFSFVL